MTWSSETIYEPLYTTQLDSTRCATLSNGNFVLVWEETTGTDNGKYAIYDTDGIEIVAPTDFHAPATFFPAVTALSTGNFFIFYGDDADSDKGKFVILNSTGGVVVAETQFAALGTTEIGATTLSDDKVVVVYRKALVTSWSIVFNADGTVFAGPTQIIGVDIQRPRLVTLDNDTVLAVFVDADTSGKLYYAILSSSGVVTTGPTLLYNGSQESFCKPVVKAGNAFIAYAPSNTGDVRFQVISVVTANGTADAGTDATHLVDSVLTTGFPEDDSLIGYVVSITSGVGIGSSATVTDYDTVSGTITITTWTGGSTPESGDGYEINPPVATVSETIVEDTSQKPVCFIQTDGKVLLVFSNSLEEQDKFVIYNMDGTISSAITNITGIYRGGMDGSSSGEKHLLMWSYSFSICTEEFGPSKAINPAPANSATDVTLGQQTISWEDGGGATSYDVYYGENEAGLSLVSAGQAGTSFTITGITYGSLFDYLISRSWRIDAVNEVGTTTGDVWTFTTISFLPPIPTYTILNGGTPPPDGVEGVDFDWSGLNNMITCKKLVVAAANKLWYES